MCCHGNVCQGWALFADRFFSQIYSDCPVSDLILTVADWAVFMTYGEQVIYSTNLIWVLCENVLVNSSPGHISKSFRVQPRGRRKEDITWLVIFNQAPETTYLILESCLYRIVKKVFRIYWILWDLFEGVSYLFVLHLLAVKYRSLNPILKTFFSYILFLYLRQKC